MGSNLDSLVPCHDARMQSETGLWTVAAFAVILAAILRATCLNKDLPAVIQSCSSGFSIGN